MATHSHQTLLLWAVRRMIADGFVITGYDGKSAQGGRLNLLPKPFVLAGSRPDAWGIHQTSMLFGFAEAKTSLDIGTAHTRQQMRTFSAVKMKASGSPCPLYMAVPRSSLSHLQSVLGDLGLSAAPNILPVGVPDILLEAA